MSDVVKRAEAALEGVKTPGTWRAITDGDNGESMVVVGEKQVNCDNRFFFSLPQVAEGFRHDGDAEFVAAAPQLVLELVAEVKRLRGRHVPQTVTRVVLVHADSKFTEKWAESWDVHIQDDGRTLKLFPQRPTGPRYEYTPDFFRMPTDAEVKRWTS